MTREEQLELDKAKKTLEDVILQSKNVFVPDSYKRFERRLQQLKCSSLIIHEPHFNRAYLIFRYLLGSFFITYLLLLSKINKNKMIQKKFSIWDSDIDPHVTDDQFIAFIESKQVIDLNNEFLFINSNISRKRTPDALFSKNPLYDIILFLDISISDSFILMKDIYTNFFIYLKISTSSPEAVKLFKDFLIAPIIKLYNKKGLTKFYRTNSSVNSQEFWCETIDFQTVLYSTNSKAFQFKNSNVNAMPEHPYFSFAHMGTVWTWDDLSAEWLKKLKFQKINIVGPILLHPIPSIPTFKKIDKKRILIFDVIPYEVLQQKGYNYYDQSRCLKFLSDILETAEESWELALKPKREFNHHHSKKYVEYVKSAGEKYKNFKVLSSKSNLFEEISKADIILSIPFSSPFCVAKSMNIPAIYYDPSGDLDFEAMGYSSDDYIGNISDLKARLAEL